MRSTVSAVYSHVDVHRRSEAGSVGPAVAAIFRRGERKLVWRVGRRVGRSEHQQVAAAGVVERKGVRLLLPSDFAAALR